VRRHAGERQRPDQPRLDEAEPAGRERDQREQLGGRIGEDDERRARRGADRVESGQKREIVEARVAGGGQRGSTPPLADRRADEVTVGDELLWDPG
jgi:hypothetical protein